MGDAGSLPSGLRAWRDRGRMIRHDGRGIFVVETGDGSADPLFVIHGFPSSSYDWVDVLPLLGDRRTVLLDLLGYGFSGKPFDFRATIFDQADIAETVARETGIERCVLVIHDLGQTVGVELMQRQEEGRLPFRIERVVVTNGSTLTDMAQLTSGQLALLSLPDEPLPEPLDLDGMKAGLAATFSREHPPTDATIDATLAGIRYGGGDRLLPRLIRYVEDRRANLERWTNALLGFSGPMRVCWGEQDPVAVVAMAHRIAEARPGTPVVTWPDVGHWPMIEVPDRMAAEILAGD